MLPGTNNPLLKWRLEHHYTQADVAQLSGLTEQTIRRVEHGTLAMPEEIAHLMGGSAEHYYEAWRSAKREEFGQLHAAYIQHSQYISGSESMLHNAFALFRLGLNFPSVNRFATAIKVDPRRITEVENGSRPLSAEYRRALLQIRVQAQTLQNWEAELDND